MNFHLPASPLAWETAASFRVTARHIDSQADQGRNVTELLAEKAQTDQASWYNWDVLRYLSRAIAQAEAAAVDRLAAETAQSFAATGRYLDAQVAQGHDLSTLLAERAQTEQAYWYNPCILRYFSKALAAAEARWAQQVFGNAPIVGA